MFVDFNILIANQIYNVIFMNFYNGHKNSVLQFAILAVVYLVKNVFNASRR